MNKSYANMNREELIDEVMEVTKCTITYWEDWTALEKLLAFVPTERLKEFLPEEESYDDTPDWSGKGASPMMEPIPIIDTPDFDLGDVQEDEMSEEEEAVDTAYKIATEKHNFFGTFEEYKKNVWELLKSTYIDTPNKDLGEVDWRTLPWPPQENDSCSDK